MKYINDWNDLRAYGINYLTGEACAVGKRLLCDVNERGRRLFCSIFGLPPDTAFAENWNSTVNGESAVGSVFLPRFSFSFIAAMILLEVGCQCAVVMETGEVWGIESHDDVATEDDPLGQIREFHKIQAVYEPLNVPRHGLSAVHAMTGQSQ